MYKKNKNKLKSSKILITISIIVIIPIIFLLFSNNSNVSDIKMVSGTEYISGEEGQIIVRLENEKGEPITDAECIVSLLYPDKSFFFTDRNLEQTSVPGNYYTPFITPSREGIYEEHIRCNTSEEGALSEMRISSSFHVSAGLNMIREMSISQREEFNLLFNELNNTKTELYTEIKNLKNDIAKIKSEFDSSNSNIENEINSLQNNVSNSLIKIENIVKKNENSSSEKLAALGKAISDIFTD